MFDVGETAENIIEHESGMMIIYKIIEG